MMERRTLSVVMEGYAIVDMKWTWKEGEKVKKKHVPKSDWKFTLNRAQAAREDTENGIA